MIFQVGVWCQRFSKDDVKTAGEDDHGADPGMNVECVAEEKNTNECGPDQAHEVDRHNGSGISQR